VKLADRLVDAVIVSNVLFQTDSKYGVALEAKRILKPDGKVLLVDWQDSYGGLGPDPDHVFTEAQAEEVFKEAGFIVDNRFNAGDHHYGLVFKLASR
jgi:SAM-dependent methyltransferase